jgi:TM2 domain-containing membrane protein YozV
VVNLFTYLPELDGEEMAYINTLVQGMNETQTQQFAMIYKSRRKEPQTIMILTIVGFLGFLGVPSAGMQRFALGQIGMGILYLFTFGLCFVGTIVDLVNYRKMTAKYNLQQAYETAMMMRAMGAA